METVEVGPHILNASHLQMVSRIDDGNGHHLQIFFSQREKPIVISFDTPAERDAAADKIHAAMDRSRPSSFFASN